MTGSSPDHGLWFTDFLNHYVAAPANFILDLARPLTEYVGIAAHNPQKPWADWMAMEIVAILVIVAIALLVKSRLSVDKPGGLQQIVELMYEGLKGQAEDIIGHGYKKYVPMFVSFFFFILVGNLLGIIPTFLSPTMFYVVPAGVALVSFFYYNIAGVKEMGLFGHLKHFAGPVLFLAPFMFVLEIISHCIRPVSLTIRLFANMDAGERVTLGFMDLVPWILPIPTILLHVFVSFLQAFIFTVLSIVYVAGVTVHEEH